MRKLLFITLYGISIFSSYAADLNESFNGCTGWQEFKPGVGWSSICPSGSIYSWAEERDYTKSYSVIAGHSYIFTLTYRHNGKNSARIDLKTIDGVGGILRTYGSGQFQTVTVIFNCTSSSSGIRLEIRNDVGSEVWVDHLTIDEDPCTGAKATITGPNLVCYDYPGDFTGNLIKASDGLAFYWYQRKLGDTNWSYKTYGGPHTHVKPGFEYRVKTVQTDGCVSQFSDPFLVADGRSLPTILPHETISTGCTNGKAYLSTSVEDVSYKWIFTTQPNSGTDSNVSYTKDVLITKAGYYRLETKNAHGCVESSDWRQTTMSQAPTPPIFPSINPQILRCDQKVRLYTSEGAAGYKWYSGNSGSQYALLVPGTTYENLFGMGYYFVSVLTPAGSSGGMCWVNSVTKYIGGPMSCATRERTEVVNEENDFDSKHFLISPNPANDVLKITLANKAQINCPIEIYDLSGRVITSTSIQIGETEKELPVSQINEGLYQVRINDHGRIRVYRIAITH